MNLNISILQEKSKVFGDNTDKYIPPRVAYKDKRGMEREEQI